ncbi:MAG: hypothetical protein ABR568_03840 [Pyrinomonadaceae bacterium]
MTEPKDVLLENLKETLKGAERYFLSGSVSALFILLLAARGQLAAGAVEQEVKVPIAGLSAPTFGAALIALAIYILSGWMIFSSVKHVRQIKGDFLRLEEENLLNAALTYPSMLKSWLIVCCVAALGTLAMTASFYFSEGLQKAVITGLLASHPYLIVAIWLGRSPICTK